MKHFFCFFLPIILGLIACELWHYELQARFGWASLEWLRVELWSPYLICILPVFSYLLPHLWQKPFPLKQYFIAFVLLYVSSITLFLFTEPFVKAIFGRFGFLAAGYLIPILFFSLFFASVLFFVIKKRYLQPNLPYWSLIFVLVAFAAIVPMSNTTVYYYPGYGNGQQLVDAIKMGYPVFWTTVFLGWAGAIQGKAFVP